MAPTPVDCDTPTAAATEGPIDDTLPSVTEPHVRSAERGPMTYQLGEVIGRGGMGEVVLARDRTIGRDVALKRLRGATPSAELVDRFLREAKVQARLDHPAIVPVHELGHDAEGRPYFTMKRITGTTLLALLEARTEKQQRLLRGLVDVCLAIELAHTRRVVHRDLKPSNIMLGDYGEVYVLDWGVARVLADPDDSHGGLPDIASLDGETKAGALLGTPGYMAPEQARGEPVGPPADVYALGAILFEVLTGETLHPRGHAGLAATVEGGEHSPAQRAPSRGVPFELDRICTAALAADPAKRPTARTLANAIQAYLDGDRDLERRRQHAVALIAESRAATTAGDQAGALNAAGRAAALDPGSTEANRLILELLVDAESPPPSELQKVIAEDEKVAMRERSRRAVVPYATLLLLLPASALLHVRSWSTFLAINLAILAGVFVTWFNTRRELPPLVPLGIHLLTVLGLSRCTGPFVVLPILISAVLLSATSLPRLVGRPVLIFGWTFAASTLPLLLERIGVFGRTWAIDQSGLSSFGTVFEIHPVDTSFLVIGSIVALMIVAWFASVLGRDRRDAQRRLTIQLWRFQQLLPRTDRAATAAP